MAISVLLPSTEISGAPVMSMLAVSVAEGAILHFTVRVSALSPKVLAAPV